MTFIIIIFYYYFRNAVAQDLYKRKLKNDPGKDTFEILQIKNK